MPVVFRKDGFAFEFYANDHAPPHVHVRRAGKRCRILLWSLEITDNNMKDPDLARALWLVAKHRGTLLRAWKKFETRKKNA